MPSLARGCLLPAGPHPRFVVYSVLSLPIFSQSYQYTEHTHKQYDPDAEIRIGSTSREVKL